MRKEVCWGTIMAMLCLLIPTGRLAAQNTTSSPYSYYGIGELLRGGNAQTAGMGGTYQAFKGKNSINFSNPASLTALDSMKFIFNVGGSVKFTEMKQQGNTDDFSDYNFTGLEFGFRVAPNWYTGLGLVPYSSLGYKVQQQNMVEGGTEIYNSLLEGTGGFNQLVWANALQLGKGLSLGINAIFLFGTNDHNETILLNDDAAFAYHHKERLNVTDVYFNLGVQYETPLTTNWGMSLGATFQPGNKLSAKYSTYTSSSQSSDDEFDTETKGNMKLPAEVGLGVGFCYKDKLWMGADVLHQQWSEADLLRGEDYLKDRTRFSLGAEYRPQEYSRSLWKQMKYRVGGFYDTGYFQLKGEDITSYGVSLGLGIPMGKGKGWINMALEYGQTGTTNNSLVQENFTRITLGISLMETWFAKRKYD
ncbi:MAG: OmpP1/FadL family transporter [Marinifilaceae bacterium]